MSIPDILRSYNKLIWSIDTPASANCLAWYFLNMWDLIRFQFPTLPRPKCSFNRSNIVLNYRSCILNSFDSCFKVSVLVNKYAFMLFTASWLQNVIYCWPVFCRVKWNSSISGSSKSRISRIAYLTHSWWIW